MKPLHTFHIAHLALFCTLHASFGELLNKSDGIIKDCLGFMKYYIY